MHGNEVSQHLVQQWLSSCPCTGTLSTPLCGSCRGHSPSSTQALLQGGDKMAQEDMSCLPQEAVGRPLPSRERSHTRGTHSSACLWPAFLGTERIWPQGPHHRVQGHQKGTAGCTTATFTVSFSVICKPQELLFKITTIFACLNFGSQCLEQASLGLAASTVPFGVDEESLCPGSGRWSEQRLRDGKACTFTATFCQIPPPFG